MSHSHDHREGCTAARLVILRESKSQDEYKERIRFTYEQWLSDHVKEVMADKGAAPLLLGIHARKGTDENGKTAFATVFYFKSEEAMAKYNKNVALRMRLRIEDVYPGATTTGGFDYEIKTFNGADEVKNIDTAVSGLKNLREIQYTSRHGSLAAYNPQKEPLPYTARVSSASTSQNSGAFIR